MFFPEGSRNVLSVVLLCARAVATEIEFLIRRTFNSRLGTREHESHSSYFADAAGSEVKFDEHGDGLARYEILNFRKGTNNNGGNGYHYRVRFISSDLITVTRHCIIADVYNWTNCLPAESDKFNWNSPGSRTPPPPFHLPSLSQTLVFITTL